MPCLHALSAGIFKDMTSLRTPAREGCHVLFCLLPHLYLFYSILFFPILQVFFNSRPILCHAIRNAKRFYAFSNLLKEAGERLGRAYINHEIPLLLIWSKAVLIRLPTCCPCLTVSHFSGTSVSARKMPFSFSLLNLKM